MELTISLIRSKELPLYEQIYNHIKEEIKKGAFPAGTRLPSTRSLATHLTVSRSTTQIAYEQLLSEGYIEVIPCKGYFVAEIETLLDVGKAISDSQAKGSMRHSALEIAKEAVEAFAIDFSLRGIDLESFPYKVWQKLSKKVLNEENGELFTSGNPQGDIHFRKALCRYLHTARGVNCEPEQIIVGAGNEYLLMLLNQLLPPNCRIAMENPTYPQAYRVLQALNYEIIPVPTDDNGIDIQQLAGSGADVCYVMPSHHFPLGTVMPIKRRQKLLTWANGQPAGKERYIIEDDYDSEFRYKGRPIPALQGIDHNQKVIYIGTFSKSVAPAIRVSYMVLPLPLLKEYQEKAGFFASTVSRIDQAILTRFLTEGYYERHLNKMRAVYKGKHDLLLQELRPFEKIFTIKGDHAGTHLLLVGKNENAAERKAAAARAGVKVYDLSQYGIGSTARDFPNTILLGYAKMSLEDIKEGCRRLQQVWPINSDKNPG